MSAPKVLTGFRTGDANVRDIANSDKSTTSGESEQYFKVQYYVSHDSGRSDSSTSTYASFENHSCGHDRNGNVSTVRTFDNPAFVVDGTADQASSSGLDARLTTISCNGDQQPLKCSGPHASPDSPSASIKTDNTEDCIRCQNKWENMSFSRVFRHVTVINTKENWKEGQTVHQTSPSPQKVIVEHQTIPKIYSNGNEDGELQTKLKTNSSDRIITVLKVAIPCALVAAVIAGVLQYKILETDGPRPNKTEALTCVNSDHDVTVSLGNQISYSCSNVSNSSKVVLVCINTVSSSYKILEPKHNCVNSSTSEFIEKLGKWIVDYNISRTDSRLRLIQNNATCQSNGTYRLLLEYENGLNTTTEFEVRVSDPKLEQTIENTGDKILVLCELKEACVAISLALYGSSGGYSYLIPGVDTCSQYSEEIGTKVTLKASVLKSSISADETISCVIMKTTIYQIIVSNLTKAITICNDSGIEPNCTNIPEYGLYYPDRNNCSNFYQCDNGNPVKKPCAPGTYWEPSICTCAKFNSSICDQDSKRWIHIDSCTLQRCSYNMTMS